MASLIFFVGSKVGMLGTVGVLGCSYATRNMVAAGVGVALLYYAAGGRM